MFTVFPTPEKETRLGNKKALGFIISFPKRKKEGELSFYKQYI